jgi:lipopolysaccharide transport system ATP-binding protein
MSDIAIRVENLSKLYPAVAPSSAMIRCATRSFERLNVPTFQRSNEDLWALKDVSFDVKQGEVVGTLAPAVARRASAGVIGRNGAGKSTLLKILSRITEPTGGRAETFGGRVASLLDASRGTGSQSDPKLILRPDSGPARTSAARERRDASRGHTAPAVCASVHRAEIDRKFDEIAAFAEIERFLDTPVKGCFSGTPLARAAGVLRWPHIAKQQSNLSLADRCGMIIWKQNRPSRKQAFAIEA